MFYSNFKKMKKAIYAIIFSGLILSLFSSCDKQLDLSPEGTLVEDKVYEEEGSTLSALADAYFKLFTSSRGNAYLLGDFTTGNVHVEPGSYFDNFINSNFDPNDDHITAIWTQNFELINLCNVIIAKVPQFAKYGETKQKQFVAEAKFIRAMSFMNLLKYFGDGALTGNMNGLGLPLQLKFYEGYDKGNNIPRSTNGEVYAQIVKDLTEAFADVPLKHANNEQTRARATKGGVNAILARVYLYMGEHQKASDAAALVISDKENYGLMTNMYDLFPSNPNGIAQSLSKENIFAFPVSSNNGNQYGDGTQILYYYKYYYWIPEEYKNLMADDDQRKEKLIFQGTDNANLNADKETTFKFNNKDSRDNISVVRLAEVILTKAECLANLNGVNQESVNLLNSIITRAKSDATPYNMGDFASKDKLIERILLERRIELAYEGLHRFDVIRTGGDLKNPDLPENKKVLPIPQREIDITEGVLVQNPGYLN